ncbi:MAG: glycosyl hydrolase 53 family protein [Paludibacter sp.]
MRTHKTLCIAALLLFISVATHASSPFAKGADISWLPQMEATGYKFYNDNGMAEDCFKILKDHGINSIRLRTWVNPSADRASGHCSKTETVAMAVRAQSWGMRVMIDFHYSDSWADPAKQVKPKAWEGLSFEQLQQAFYDYTYDVMTALKTAGVTPEWVQVGNEIPGGMVYPEGSNSSSWTQLVKLINKGYDAIKAVSPTSKVILHIDQGNDNARFRWWFDNAKANGAKYDVIGMSYYPYWLSNTHPDYTLSINDLGTNLKDMVSRYGKEVMVVETGGEDTKPQNTFDMLLAVQNKVLAVPDNSGLGVFYWEPEGARSWSNYALSAWGSNGRPTMALDAFNISTGLDISKTEPVFALWNEQSLSFTLNCDAAKITLIDLSGVEICRSDNSRSIPGGGLSTGTYLLKVNLSNSTDSVVLKVIRP